MHYMDRQEEYKHQARQALQESRVERLFEKPFELTPKPTPFEQAAKLAGQRYEEAMLAGQPFILKSTTVLDGKEEVFTTVFEPPSEAQRMTVTEFRGVLDNAIKELDNFKPRSPIGYTPEELYGND